MSWVPVACHHLVSNMASVPCKWEVCVVIVPAHHSSIPGSSIDSVQNTNGKWAHKPTPMRTAYHSPRVICVPNLPPCLPTILWYSFTLSHSHTQPSDHPHTLVTCTWHQAHLEATRWDILLPGCIHWRQRMNWRPLVWCGTSGRILGVQWRCWVLNEHHSAALNYPN